MYERAPVNSKSVYQDGVLAASVATSNDYTAGQERFWIGEDSVSGKLFEGDLDEMCSTEPYQLMRWSL